MARKLKPPYPWTDGGAYGNGRSAARDAARRILAEIRDMSEAERFSRLKEINERLLRLQAEYAARGDALPVVLYHPQGFHVAKGFTYAHVVYEKRIRNEHQKERAKFSATEKKKYVRYLAEAKLQELKKVGFSDIQIEEMRDGVVPNGWQVHHRVPLDDTGTNEQENLILIKNIPEHRAVHGYYNPSEQLVKMLDVQESVLVAYPVPPKGCAIYPDGSDANHFWEISFEDFAEMFR